MKATRQVDDQRVERPLVGRPGHCKVGEYTVTGVTAVDRPAAEFTALGVPDTELGKQYKQKQEKKNKMPHSGTTESNEHPSSAADSSALTRLHAVRLTANRACAAVSMTVAR